MPASNRDLNLGPVPHSQRILGGILVAEAPGLAAIVSGARSLQPNDDALLLSVTPSLDSLYHMYRTEQG